MQPEDGGIPALLLEPGHGADAGPDPVPVGYVSGQAGQGGADLRGVAEAHHQQPGAGGPGSQNPGPPRLLARPHLPHQVSSVAHFSSYAPWYQAPTRWEHLRIDWPQSFRLRLENSSL